VYVAMLSFTAIQNKAIYKCTVEDKPKTQLKVSEMHTDFNFTKSPEYLMGNFVILIYSCTNEIIDPSSFIILYHY